MLQCEEASPTRNSGASGQRRQKTLTSRGRERGFQKKTDLGGEGVRGRSQEETDE